MSDPALAIRDLRKTYASGVDALKGIDLEVDEGDFFALLGPNGAGKSTTINIVIGLTRKTGGRVEVFGRDIDQDFGAAKRCIGVVPQEQNFNIFERLFDIVVGQAGYYGIPKRAAEERAEKYLKQLDLWSRRDVQAQTLSGGLKRRLMIARALVHEPQLLILDEPTAGVDVETRRSMWRFIEGLNTEGRTIILTTHYLEEAESLCRNVAIIDRGTIVEKASMRDLLRRIGTERYRFDLAGSARDLPPLEGYATTPVDDSTLEVEVSKGQNLNELFEYFRGNGIEVVGMRTKTAKLEELFLNLVEGERDR